MGSMTSRRNCKKLCSLRPRMCHHRELFAVLFDNEQRGKRIVHTAARGEAVQTVTAIAIQRRFFQRVR